MQIAPPNQSISIARNVPDSHMAIATCHRDLVFPVPLELHQVRDRGLSRDA